MQDVDINMIITTLTCQTDRMIESVIFYSFVFREFIQKPSATSSGGDEKLGE